MVLTVVRWGAAGLAGLLCIGALASFLIFISLDLPHWLDRARRLRTWIWLLGLFWFNCEVWGRVVYTIVTWR
jgi:hypothetical protein